MNALSAAAKPMLVGAFAGSERVIAAQLAAPGAEWRPHHPSGEITVAIGNIRDTIKANWQDAAARRPVTDDEWKFLFKSAIGQMKIEQAKRTAHAVSDYADVAPS